MTLDLDEIKRVSKQALYDLVEHELLEALCWSRVRDVEFIYDTHPEKFCVNTVLRARGSYKVYDSYALNIVGYDSPSIQMLEFLVGCGANIEARDEYGYTPLIIAAQCANQEMVDFLIKRGVDVNAPGSDGIPPICQTACVEVVQLLLNAGADVEAMIGETGSSVLEYIEQNCQPHKPEIPELVVKHLAKLEKTRLEASIVSPTGKPSKTHKL
ncbi:MAG TPA: ankyrin repeat domain-containing protein [Anaerovoracaceae bacterium]|nr:ankyrin repeat domain-containing protein [Anaerovoracaceae bacterium]